MRCKRLYRGIGHVGLLIACLTVGSTFSQAQQAAPGQPPSKVVSGVVEWVDHENGAIVVGDGQFLLPPALKGGGAVQKGMKIRLRYVWQGQQKVISEILN